MRLIQGHTAGRHSHSASTFKWEASFTKAPESPSPVISHLEFVFF